jgi:hydroxymethylbilane synthase
LAIAQTNYIVGLIQAKHPGVEITIHTINTMADKDRVSEFHQFGITGVFSIEHEEQLIRKEVDLVVHSLKDLPTDLREGLCLAAVPARESPLDVLCGATLAGLRSGAKVGTGSLRRRAQILSLRPDVEVVPIRGNVGPRLQKTEGKEGLDAVILAAAGLHRLGLDDAASEVLDPLQFPYAVGQGALGVECRADHAELLAILRDIQDPRIRAEVDAERAMMHALGAGCSLPVGVVVTWEGDRMRMLAQVTSLNGREKIIAKDEDTAENAVALGLRCAGTLREKGGVALLESSYREFCSHFKLVH